MFVRGQNLLEGAVLEKVPDVEMRGFVRRRAKARVEAEVAEDEVGPAVTVQVGDLNGVPPALGARKPYVRSPVHEVAVFLMKDTDRHPLAYDDQVELAIVIVVHPGG